MESLDLSILKKVPELNKEIVLEIQPLAPLSMVSDLPGSYFKTLHAPNKKIICGLFENILEWHIDLIDRKKIIKELKKIRKKQKTEFIETDTGSSYIPLLMEYFEIRLISIPITMYYDDLWTRAFRRNDSYRHTNNSRHFEFTFTEKWRNIKKSVLENKKRDSTQKNALLDKLFKRYLENFPTYYGSPTSREYIVVNGNYKIKLEIDSDLYNLLSRTLLDKNLGYIGNNEGWVNIEIK